MEPFGTGNRCALFRHGYIELIAVLDTARFDNGLGAWLGRYEGLHIVALAMEDEVANPALGLAAPPGRYPWQPHARGLAAHLLYGLVAELALRALAPRGQPRPSASRNVERA